MKPATHSGTCQVCGNHQKLPGGGLLSTHGYTVEHGFFEGTCSGANNLPFELSISLIRGAIESAKQSAIRNRAEAQKRRAMTDAGDVWHSVYVNYKTHRVHGRVEMANKFSPTFITNFAGQERRKSMNPGNLADAVRGLNESEARRLEQLAKQADTYVEWQTKRIKGWKPHPEKLVAVKAERKGTLVHWAGGYFGVACSSSAYGAQKIWNKTPDISKVTCAKCLKRHAEMTEHMETLAPEAKAAYVTRYMSPK